MTSLTASVGALPSAVRRQAQLQRAGADVLVLDRERLPRLKLCAGWITPEVVRDLGMDLASYPHRLLTFPRLRVHLGRVHIPVPCVQHSIRRFEFDAWLLERSGAPVEQHNVRYIAADGAGYVVDELYRCRFLIGAGGTRCPVYRELFREVNPRAHELQIVTLEHEINDDWHGIPTAICGSSRTGCPDIPGTCPRKRAGLMWGVGALAATPQKQRRGHQGALRAPGGAARGRAHPWRAV